jgi:hypothetical protein
LWGRPALLEVTAMLSTALASAFVLIVLWLLFEGDEMA